MKPAIVAFKKNIRTITLLFDLISPILLYFFLNGGKLLLSAVLFVAVILIRIIYVVI
jgi:hypothetical protein